MKLNRLFASLLAVSLLAACNRSAVQPLTVDYTMPDGTVKLISYNVRLSTATQDGDMQWKHRKQGTAAMIQEQAPSVFGIQEGILDQVEFIEQTFPQYARVGVGRDDGKQAGEHMAIFYLKEKFDLLDSSTIWLSETPDSVSKGWDAACFRTATTVHLREKSTGKEFWYINTHLDHIGEIARRESARLLADCVASIRSDSTAAVILGGDLNSTIEDDIFEPLRGTMGIARNDSPVTDRKGTFNGFGTAPTSIVIDHIFYTGVRPLEFCTLDGNYGVPYISDHYPIEFVFEL